MFLSKRKKGDKKELWFSLPCKKGNLFYQPKIGKKKKKNYKL